MSTHRSSARTPTALNALGPVHYSVHLDEARAHVITVVLTIEHPQALQRLELPVWIPGSYLVREFSKDLMAIKATQKKRPQAVEQLNKNTCPK